jgi:magnesium chelatase family protein
MSVYSFAPLGFEGCCVSVETDIRPGIPGTEVVGLPGSTVREARMRVRSAIRNSGFQYPVMRILINMAPADVPKAGSHFDLPIAASLMAAAGELVQLPYDVLMMGELELSGRIRPVRGVLSAVAAGLAHGIERFIIPDENLKEAAGLAKGMIAPVRLLSDLPRICSSFDASCVIPGPEKHAIRGYKTEGDFAEIRGQGRLKRAAEIAAAGRHHLLMFGPPGSGKTMTARRMGTILPPLSEKEAVEVTKVHSLAGLLSAENGLIRHGPVRMPHHSASVEGLIGGGKDMKPGELSLAHRGILFLDEAFEFKQSFLQALREPLESGRVVIARAGRSLWYPADVQLILAANPCPCGQLGNDDKICLCSPKEIRAYWKRLSGPMLDRIDIRVPVKPGSTGDIFQSAGEPSAGIRKRVAQAVSLQTERYSENGFSRNSEIPPGQIHRYCRIPQALELLYQKAAHKLGLSVRAGHSILKVARTIADLAGSKSVEEDHLLEAIQHRRYGEEDIFWN